MPEFFHKRLFREEAEKMMNNLELTDIQRRNLEILVFDALFYIKKKRHSLTEDEVNELLTILQIDHKNKVS